MSEAPLDPIPPPALPETMLEKTEPPPSGNEESEKRPTQKDELPEPEYPSRAEVIPIVAALYSAFFLVALVPQPLAPRPSTHN